MRRVAILAALITLDMWLIAGSAWDGEAVGPVALVSAVSAQDVCCQVGQSPHLACVGGMCQQVASCGLDDCSACTGCDPTLEATCIDIGGIWDPVTCTCTAPPLGCDPILEFNCNMSGGQWDPDTCTCGSGSICVLDDPVLVNQTSASYSYCSGTTDWECTVTWSTYEERCQDGRVRDSWTEETTVCTGTPHVGLLCE